MLASIWFKIVYLLPAVIIFAIIPLGIIWVAFYFLKPKGMSFLKTGGLVVFVYFAVSIFQLFFRYVLGVKSIACVILLWVLGFVLFTTFAEKYNKMSVLESFKLFVLIFLTSFIVVIAGIGFLGYF